MHSFQNKQVINCKSPAKFPIAIECSFNFQSKNGPINIGDIGTTYLVFKQNGEIVNFPATVTFGRAEEVHNLLLANIYIEESVKPGIYTIHLQGSLLKIPEEMNVVLRVLDSEPVPNYYLRVDYFYHTIEDNARFTVGMEDKSVLCDDYTYVLYVYEGPHFKRICPETIDISKDKKTATFEIPVKDLNVHKFFVENNVIACNLFLIDKDEKEYTTNSLNYVSLISKDDLPDPSLCNYMLNYPEINKKIQPEKA